SDEEFDEEIPEDTNGETVEENSEKFDEESDEEFDEEIPEDMDGETVEEISEESDEESDEEFDEEISEDMDGETVEEISEESDEEFDEESDEEIDGELSENADEEPAEEPAEADRGREEAATDSAITIPHSISREPVSTGADSVASMRPSPFAAHAVSRDERKNVARYPRSSRRVSDDRLNGLSPDETPGGRRLAKLDEENARLLAETDAISVSGERVSDPVETLRPRNPSRSPPRPIPSLLLLRKRLLGHPPEGKMPRIASAILSNLDWMTSSRMLFPGHRSETVQPPRSRPLIPSIPTLTPPPRLWRIPRSEPFGIPSSICVWATSPI
ncbi:MAG: hypothetical protein IJD38_09100, partial [Clostridia bacterium]|nr:hypothetical protein [Clostridia bacterium]